MQPGAWMSITQFARTHGYGRASVSQWVNELLSDASISTSVKAALVFGQGRSRRVHAERFRAWLTTRNRTNVIVVHTAGEIQ